MDTGTLFGDDKPVWLDQELPSGKGCLIPWSGVNRVDYLGSCAEYLVSPHRFFVIVMAYLPALVQNSLRVQTY